MNLKEAVIARLNRGNHNFEIFVNLDKALKFREGKIKDIREVLVVEEIFKDAKKGERTSSEVLKNVFKTDDIYKIAEIIVKEGEINITTEYRRKMIEEKRKLIIEYILRIAVDARTNLPLTRDRLENMLDEIRYNIDPFKDHIEQANEIIKELKKKFPLKIEIKKVKVKLSYDKMRGVEILKRKYNLEKEFYEEQWIGIFNIPIGLYSDFLSDIHKIDPEAIVEELPSK